MPVRLDRYFDPKLVKEMSNPLLIDELTRSKKLHLPTKSTRGKGEGFSLRLSLKVICNENFAVLGQFCAKIIQTGGRGGGGILQTLPDLVAFSKNYLATSWYDMSSST